MSTIIPSPILDLSKSLIGDECTRSLLVEFNVKDVGCVKLALSKGLGIGIIVGGSIVKVPQIIAIVSSKTSAGLSLPSSVMEALSYLITLVYSYRSNFPFSTYGENFFLSVQSILVTGLIIAYAPSSPYAPDQTGPRGGKVSSLITTISLLVLCLSALLGMPKEMLSLAAMGVIPISLSAKVPQVLKNYREGSTGVVSFIGMFAQTLGALARVFTSTTEVGDPIITLGFLLAFLLNGTIAAQCLIYPAGKVPKEEEQVKAGVKEALRSTTKFASIAGQEKEGVNDTMGDKVKGVYESEGGRRSPSPSLGGSGRKWSRKLD